MSLLTNVAFTVPGEPQGKGRARIGRVGGFARMFTPAKTAAYEGLVALAAKQAMNGHAPMSDAVRLDVEIVCAVPASWSAKKRSQALCGLIRPAKKPDADNIVKALCDGMNGVVWNDDVQAVEGGWKKVYGQAPGVHVHVAALLTAEADVSP